MLLLGGNRERRADGKHVERWDRMEGRTGHSRWRQGSSKKLGRIEMGQAGKI